MATSYRNSIEEAKAAATKLTKQRLKEALSDLEEETKEDTSDEGDTPGSGKSNKK